MNTKADTQLNKRQAQHKKTLEAIRKAVDQLVSEVGFEKMRVIDIANIVGISEGTFYHYFKSKNELLYDRFHRSNNDLLQCYEKSLKDIDEIDALKHLIQYGTAYSKDRVVEVLISFENAKLDEYLNWTGQEQDAKLFIINQLVASGRKNGTIKSIYTQDQIVDFINTYFEGTTYLQCLTRGEFLERMKLEPLICDWLESLRT